jgi:membrane-associated phospholipid phosphatase
MLVLRYTRLGEHGRLWYCVALAGALVDGSRRRHYLRTARAVAIAFVANAVIKLAVRRARPLMEDLPALSPTYSTRSYPSAHAATSFAAAATLSEVLPRRAVYAAALAMAISRPYLGVHYPSDSLAGAVLGRAVARMVP